MTWKLSFKKKLHENLISQHTTTSPPHH